MLKYVDLCQVDIQHILQDIDLIHILIYIQGKS